MIWNDETENRLRELAGRNLSGGVIGRLLGCSKNTIIGKARRLGVALNGHVRDGMNAEATVRETKKLERQKQARERHALRREHTPEPAPIARIKHQHTVVDTRNLEEATSDELFEYSTEVGTAINFLNRTKPERVKTLFDVLPIVPAEIEDILTELRREPICEAIEDVGGEGVSLLDLRADDCRAIVGEDRYCGAPVHKSGSSWCKEHHARFCQTPAQARVERLGRWS